MAISWLERRLVEAGTDAETVMMAEHSRLSAGNVTMGNIIKSLREIDDTEWSVWVEEVSKVDKLLWKQTDYAELDAGSRNKYRKQIEKYARRSDRSEIEVAQLAIDMTEAAKRSAEPQPHEPNVGGFLVGSQRHALEAAINYRQTAVQRIIRPVRKLNWLAIAAPVLILTVIVLAIVGSFMIRAGMGAAETIVLLLMFSLPASEGATGLFNTLITFFVTPARLVGYEFKEGVPEDARTLVAVPCMINNRDSVDELVRNLEVHYLANPRGEIYFALLSDWPDSKVEESDADLEVLDYARREIANLSMRYAYDGKTRFYLLHRRRLYNPAEGVWMGWERKRGKLHELNMLLRGDRDTTYLPGANVVPKDVQYVMTLDADTRLMRDTVTKLVGKLYHPINRPVVDPETKRVVSGYGVLQPRVTPSLTTGKDASVFQRVFSINRGLDPYVFTVSDVYQDLCGEGTFTGKGLYHVDAFENSLKGKIDENSVLSHDLLEGSMARCALVTDCELVEDFPIRYEVEVSRQHRWARGDWQLLPYIFSPQRGVTGLGRWKMFDNLRRSLTPIAWFFASVLGWYFMGPLAALIWQILLIFCLFVAPTLSLINGLVPRTSDIVARAHLYTIWTDIQAANAQVALRIVFIADSACGMADAIVRSLYRLLVSHKLMLQWRTAASAQAMAQTTILGHYRVMWHAPALAVASLAIAAIPGDNAFLVGIPFALLWMLSPGVAWYVSQTAETEDKLVVSEHVSNELRKIARRTWRYFESFVVPQQHYLPPDNVQQTPHPVVAARTSPTNIGVYLLSVVSARHFGWIAFEETIERLEQTIATLDKMEKFRGHLLNWYHTDTLKPLGQRYVSAVDSGNLAGHLIAVSSACRIWAEAPSAHMQGNLDGIGDVAGILGEVLHDLPDDRKTVRPLRRRLEERIVGFQNALAAVKREHEFASIRIINLSVLARDIEKLAANLDHEVKTAQSGEVTKWAESLVKVCEGHIADSVFDLSNVDALRQRLIHVRDRARDLAFSMDFAFLFRPERRLLSIGYRVETGELDAACYDLLASEARLTSLFAIAKGDLPTEHWYRLGRQVVPVGSRGALVSWSGSMFEYLMPPLVMQERQGGILNQTNNLIVIEQMNYGRRLGIPWGISEAAFNARDHHMNYQYTNFGVPTLGLKRGLGQNAVIAPYASILASMYDPDAALENLERLRKVGALGTYGFHDAVDFTPTRVPEGKNLRGGPQLLCPPPRHVDRGRCQRRVQRPSARALPLGSRDRGSGAAATGKGAARNPGHGRQARDRCSGQHPGGSVAPAGSQDQRSRRRGPRARVSLERPLLADADGNRRRLFALERPFRLALACRPDGRPLGYLHLPARHPIRPMVVGDRRAAQHRGRKGQSLLQRRKGGVREVRRRSHQRGGGHRRDRERRGGSSRHAAEHGARGSLHRSHLLSGAGGRERRCRFRPPGLRPHVRPHRDRPPRRRDPRRAQQARPERTGHGACPSDRRQCGNGASDRIRDRSPPLHRPWPEPGRSRRLRSGGNAFGNRRLHARCLPVAAPRRSRAGRQKGQRDLLDDRGTKPRGDRQGRRPLPPSRRLCP